MTGQEFDAALDKVGLSQRSAGRSGIFGVGDRQIRKWVANESAIPESAANLIRIMIKYKISPEDVEKLAERAARK
ncbi:hypothetical protein [Bradyrhizobium cenepequi]|uniref:hypothetical protein n=1 Tax=Bradyrhizobium cenepequi TaxID=2821403 RepID=UPI001CE2F347|nr:hypothetical protein [Bradyrhizobium cenepequi]MCA6108140.1 hypothetical protein [Bradyrhizobium cenepequi]